LAVWKDTPVHDSFSHGYKSFESAAIRPEAITWLEATDDDEDDRRDLASNSDWRQG
jgi:hypothetical protein